MATMRCALCTGPVDASRHGGRPRAARGRRTPILLAASVVLVAGTGCAGHEAAVLVDVPAVFDEHRVFVRPVTTDGDTLTFYTDTGGGLNMVYAPVVDRLDLPRQRVALGEDSVALVAWPEWASDAWIPPPKDTAGPFGKALAVMPFGQEAAMIHDSTTAGFLGRSWFADRVWMFDYPAGRLYLRSEGGPAAPEASARVTLGFQVDSAGRRTVHFPRLRIAVEGDSLDLLFDTGATMTLTDSALAVLADGRPPRRASSFISARVFDRWRAEHPDWRVIEEATEIGADLIQVPRVSIAGHEVGPVWFERRREGVFEEGMSRWMDRPIVGALGGNALRFFRVTADYPKAVATFEPAER